MRAENEKMASGQSCDDFELLVSRAIDGDLDREEQSILAGHLQGCPACQRVLAEMDRIDQDLRETIRSIPINVSQIVDGALERSAPSRQQLGEYCVKRVASAPDDEVMGIAACAMTLLSERRAKSVS